ncbi:uncharacterized protein [Ptychodera flava]|uniref:uncharacterized protein n=1 Tax=Ptychodera flava TaxID=63121 RepID=UPI00396A3378
MFPAILRSRVSVGRTRHETLSGRTMKVVRSLYVGFFLTSCLVLDLTDGQVSEWQPPRLMWVSYRDADARAAVQSLPANPADYLDGPISVPNHFTLYGSQWVALGENFSGRAVYFSDLTNQGIVKGTFTETNQEDAATYFLRGTSNTVDGVAVDWVTGNVYWTDVYYNWIKVIDKDGEKHQVIVKTGLEYPRALALYPQRGLMYWSDWGREPKIERSSLSGGNRQTVVNSGLYYPNGIAIDYNAERLYWINVHPLSTSTITSSDLDGNGRQVLYSQSSQTSWLFDLTIYQSYIFTTDWSHQMRCLWKNTGEEYFSLNLGVKPYGTAIYGDDNQPSAPSACDGNPCTDICVSHPTGYECVCTEGAHLLEDGRTCKQDDTLQSPLLLWSTTTQICTLPVHMGDMHLLNNNYTYRCILGDQTHVVAMDADVHGQFLFYSDYVERSIMRVRLIDGETTQVIMGGVGSVEGIAVDWINSNLYWTDNTQQHIAVSRTDGTCRKILITNMDKPRSIVVDPIRNYMYWTDFGSAPKIERAGLDGNNRAVFVSNVIQPMGLAIDFKFDRIYFADRGSQVLQSVDMNGGDITTIIQAPGAQFFDVDIYQDYIFWTQWNADIGIQFANKEENWYKRGLTHTGTAYGLKTYDDTRQPLGQGSCGTNNGGCKQLCLPRSTSGYICACGTGYTLQTDGLSCGTSTVQDNFLLASDPYQHGIFQMQLDSPSLEYSAIPIDDVQIDLPHGVDMEPTTQMIYWSDIRNKGIHRAKLDGSQSENILQGEFGTPVGLAVDYLADLVYWSDSTLGQIEVAKTDGSNRKVLINGIVEPRHIILDLQERYIYWSDRGSDAVYGKIERAFQDGSNREDVISTNIERPSGLAIDNDARKLYWCDFQLNKIEVSDLSGQNRQVLVLLPDDNQPQGLALHGQFIYWSDWRKRGVLRAFKSTGSGALSVGHRDFAILYDLHAYSQSSVVTGSNACSVIDGGCSNLCLPTPSGRTCACPEGVQIQSDGITCYGVQRCPSQFLHGSVSPLCRSLPGHNCTILCDPGYELSSNTQISCLATGQWDIDPTTLCQPRECPSLPVPAHTTTESCPQPTVYGIACIHRCVVGYVIQSGDEDRMCQGDGSWSGDDLVCQIQQCPPLAAPENGFYSPAECSTTGGVYNDVCQLSCLEGYRLEGVPSQNCLSTGLWSGNGITSLCKDVSPPDFGNTCPSDFTVTAQRGQLSAVVNWVVPTATDNSGDEVTISQNMEVPIVLGDGQHFVVVTATDLSGNSAVCSFTVLVQVLYCPQPPIPVNGYLDSPPCAAHYGSSCSVSCDEGYDLQGSSSVTCEADTSNQAYWTSDDSEPSCRIVECPEPILPDNAVQTGCVSPYTYGTECLFACAVGYYKTDGESGRTCQADGTWSGTPVECTIKSCGSFSSFPNGAISPISCIETGGFYGDVCLMNCNAGYQLQGAVSHTCLATGEWSNPDDEHACEDVTAPHFNGTCPEDRVIFATRGQTSATATWTEPMVLDNSGLPLTVTSSKVNGVTLNEGPHTVVIYATDQAGNQAMCRFVITIQVTRCSPLQAPSHGSITNTCTNHYGSECHVTCNAGYRLIGSETTRCELSSDGVAGNWTETNTVCEIVECPRLHLPSNAAIQGCDVTQEFLPYNTRCQYQCNFGYESVSGSTARTCLDNATWSGEPMNCQIKTCEGLTEPQHGTITPASCQSESNYGDQCVYNCSHGYQVTGPSTKQCLHDGTWSLNDQTTFCQDIQPPSFGETCPADIMVLAYKCSTLGLVDYVHPRAEDNAGVSFEEGPYTMLLPANWTAGLYSQVYLAADSVGLVGECRFTVSVQVVECPQLSAPVNGAIESQSCLNMYGTVAKLKCHTGYTLVGDDELYCGIDGLWDGLFPVCQAITCSSLTTPDFGIISPPECATNAELNYGTTCLLQCSDGFVLEGASQNTCGGNGSWSVDFAHSSCKDVAPPSFGQTCPPSTLIPTVLPEGTATTTATWTVPTATDNSGYVSVQGPEGVTPPVDLGPGKTFFHYTAKDGANLTSICSFFIEIVDEEPPTAINCTEDHIIESPTMPVEVRWPQPVFTDNVEVTRVVSDRNQGFSVTKWDVYTVTQTAYDAAGNAGLCITNITVTGRKQCPQLTPPMHGGLACDTGGLCTMHCNVGYFFRRKPQSDILTCAFSDDGTAYWKYGTVSDPAPGLPPCIVNGRNVKANWAAMYPGQYDHQHLDGDCADSKELIKQSFVDYVENSPFGQAGYCQQDPDFCVADKTSVTCSDVVRKRRSVDVMKAMHFKANRRDDQTVKFVDLFKTLNNSEVNMKTADVDKSRLQNKLHCDPGYILDGDICESCPVGTFHDKASMDCVRCPKGYYQDEEAQMLCKSCPENSTTLGDGIFTATDCYEMCPAGSFSFLGIVPCQQCLLGFYQPEPMQRYCLPCPKWHTTLKLGATSQDQCTALIPRHKPPEGDTEPKIIVGESSPHQTTSSWVTSPPTLTVTP